MIDNKKAYDNFVKYVSQFDRNDIRVQLKEAHSIRTANIAEMIAKGLNLTEEQVELAKLIGLLHDIGRFRQEEVYHTFADVDSCDHANLGKVVLFDEGTIKVFTDEEKYYHIIEKAIVNHNKYEIEDGLSEEELLFAKLIRDADKIDNFSVKRIHDINTLLGEPPEEVEKEKITDEVWQQFLEGKTVLSRTRVTAVDHWVSYLAWIYDINFLPGLQYMLDEGSIDRVIDRFDYKDSDTKNKMEYARKVLHEYILERANK